MLNQIPVKIYGFASSLAPSFPYTYRSLLIPVSLICYPLATSNLLYPSLPTAAWLSIAQCPGNRCFQENLRALPAPCQSSRVTFHQQLIPALLPSPPTQPVLNQKPSLQFPSSRQSIFTGKAGGTEQFPAPSPLLSRAGAGHTAPWARRRAGHGRQAPPNRGILPA